MMLTASQKASLFLGTECRVAHRSHLKSVGCRVSCLWIRLNKDLEAQRGKDQYPNIRSACPRSIAWVPVTHSGNRYFLLKRSENDAAITPLVNPAWTSAAPADRSLTLSLRFSLTAWPYAVPKVAINRGLIPPTPRQEYQPCTTIQRRTPARFTPPFRFPGFGAATALAAGATTGRATQPFGTPTVLQ